MIGIDDITPVEQRGYYLFKRDDLFMPFDFSPANGSKLRQGMILCQKHKEEVAHGLFTGTSIHSPQAVITASIAKSVGVPCKIVYGGTNAQSVRNNRYYQLCRHLGADVDFCKMGYNAVVSKRAQDLADEQGGFNIRYGFDLRSNADVFLGSVAKQVRNIPNELEYLVITIGSAITICGVMLGIEMYGKKVQNIVGVGCAPNRLQKIMDYAAIIKEQTGHAIPLQNLHYYDCYNKLRGYKYDNVMQAEYCGLKFHPRYEAKTFNFMARYVPRGQKTLMWVTGHEL